MLIKAVTFDAYGTLLRNEDLMLIPRRIVADHGLSVPIDDVWRLWIDLYGERGSAEGSPGETG
jgi:FMN phosphatase YigB (HAD superfamily)